MVDWDQYKVINIAEVVDLKRWSVIEVLLYAIYIYILLGYIVD